MQASSVIGIDPGREKCGLAVIHRQQGLLKRSVVSTTDLADAVGDLADHYQTRTIILGNGTSHRAAKAALEAAATYIIHIIDEAHTTEQARIRYWAENPPQGLRRLIPLGLQTPPEPVDGYVAAILAERWLRKET
jgi:RNase H-fold protein (predicted Holliday junction resolvase)